MEIGRIIKYYRELNNLTQLQLAEKADINEKYYGRIERDESSPTINKVENICKALDIEMIDLFYGYKELNS